VWAGKEGAAGFQNGPRGAARFRSPRGMCADANGTLIVADSNNSCIRRIDRDGAHSAQSSAGRHPWTFDCSRAAGGMAAWTG